MTASQNRQILAPGQNPINKLKKGMIFMKKARKLITFILTAVMVLSMSMNVMAENLTIDGTSEGKKYDLYKVLNLSQSENAYTYSVNEDFESFFTEKDLAAKAIDANDTSWEDPIAKIRGMANDSDELSQLAKEILVWADANEIEPVETVIGVSGESKTIINNLEKGYYLLNPLGAQGTNGTATMFSLNTLSGNESTITVKAEYPTIDKKVNGSDDAVDAVIGETVEFTLTSKVPDMTGYNAYYFIVDDTLSQGLTYEAITSIKINDVPLNEGSDYSAQTTSVDNNTNLKIVFKDFIEYSDQAGDTIEIIYTAKLNGNAVINGENTNDVKLIYSNDPKYDYMGDQPSDDTSGNVPPTGETPIDEVYVYTTEILIHKVDEAKNNLTGASFRITGESLKVTENANEFYVEDAEGTYWELKDGTFTTTDPNGGGVDNREYVNTAVKYVLKQSTDLNYESEVVYKEGAVDSDGKLIFSGLGAGTYTITEIVTPEGYNSIEPFTVTISFDADGKVFTYTKGGGNATAITTEIEVENRSGSVLPSTGGIGTTIFYIVGGALVLFAVVLLVTKKRMKDAQ